MGLFHMMQPHKEEQVALERLPPQSVVILVAIVGSTIHGTSVAAQDDYDALGIVIEPPSRALGLTNFETLVYRTQPDGVRSGPGDLDLTFHCLRKYARLAANGNPTILLPLYVPDEGIIAPLHPLGKELRARRAMFLSKKVGKAFLGYLIAQRERLMGSRGQMNVTRPELIEAYGFDVKYAGHILRLAYQGVELMTTGHLTLPMPEMQRAEIVKMRTGGFTLQQAMSRIGVVESELRDAMDNDVLPDVPDTEAIDDFIVLAYNQVWQSTEGFKR
jgi:hypothetical protein